MKNRIPLFFMLLLVGCDMSTSTKYSKTDLTLYSLVINNNVNIKNYTYTSDDDSKKPVIANCGLDCIKIHSNYDYIDRFPGTTNCTHSLTISNGNNNGIPDSGETAILRVPIFYWGSYILNSISAELISSDVKISVNQSIVKYPNMTTTSNAQFSCPSSYYSEWNTSNNINCDSDYVSECTGWQIKLPQNYSGQLNFKILLKTSIGDKILNYSL
jgi:hypothetical protein